MDKFLANRIKKVIEIPADPLIEKEHKNRLKYYKTELNHPVKSIPLEKRHKTTSRIEEWFSFGGGI